MGAWDIYKARAEAGGITQREHTLKRSQEYFSRKLPNSLSCHEVLINDIAQVVTISSRRDSMAVKKICAMPGESLEHGGIVDFAKSKWLITEIDADDEVYTRGLMNRCNCQLKWLNKHGEIIEKWCVVEDGTKYLVGEQQKDIMSVGDARIAITIAKDADTNELDRGRRFLVDDLESNDVLAFKITKPNKLYNVFNGKGVFRFILTEVNLTADDNVELRIADFFSWTPNKYGNGKHEDKDIRLFDVLNDATIESERIEDSGKEVWL